MITISLWMDTYRKSMARFQRNRFLRLGRTLLQKTVTCISPLLQWIPAWSSVPSSSWITFLWIRDMLLHPMLDWLWLPCPRHLRRLFIFPVLYLLLLPGMWKKEKIDVIGIPVFWGLWRNKTRLVRMKRGYWNIVCIVWKVHEWVQGQKPNSLGGVLVRSVFLAIARSASSSDPFSHRLSQYQTEM